MQGLSSVQSQKRKICGDSLSVQRLDTSLGLRNSPRFIAGNCFPVGRQAERQTGDNDNSNNNNKTRS